jgi:hypothetical protein
VKRWFQLSWWYQGPPPVFTYDIELTLQPGAAVHVIQVTAGSPEGLLKKVFLAGMEFGQEHPGTAPQVKGETSEQ